MKCPYCGHSHQLHRKYWGVCDYETEGALECDCPGWLPETNKPVRVVSFPGRSRAPGSGYVSAADESVVWPDDAA